jgi:hypothetical protein
MSEVLNDDEEEEEQEEEEDDEEDEESEQAMEDNGSGKSTETAEAVRGGTVRGVVCCSAAVSSTCFSIAVT